MRKCSLFDKTKYNQTIKYFYIEFIKTLRLIENQPQKNKLNCIYFNFNCNSNSNSNSNYKLFLSTVFTNTL